MDRAAAMLLKMSKSLAGVKLHPGLQVPAGAVLRHRIVHRLQIAAVENCLAGSSACFASREFLTSRLISRHVTSSV